MKCGNSYECLDGIFYRAPLGGDGDRSNVALAPAHSSNFLLEANPLRGQRKMYPLPFDDAEKQAAIKRCMDRRSGNAGNFIGSESP